MKICAIMVLLLGKFISTSFVFPLYHFNFFYGNRKSSMIIPHHVQICSNVASGSATNPGFWWNFSGSLDMTQHTFWNIRGMLPQTFGYSFIFYFLDLCLLGKLRRVNRFYQLFRICRTWHKEQLPRHFRTRLDCFTPLKLGVAEVCALVMFLVPSKPMRKCQYTGTSKWV